MVELSLLAAAVLVGATGTWSPCGFSMVETIGPNGHTGGRAVTLAACATFLPGAIAGAVVTFGGLALLGSALPGGWLTYAAAALIAVVAAVAEVRGARIAPQIRRQLPEHWRRVMPMPVAAALYGVLLGLGFTTFVLTFGVWALAGIALALGEPAVGLAIGAGFGVGRALPIICLAPIAHRPAGRSAIELMADRPGLYRGIRIGDAAALAVAAVALWGAAGAEADTKSVRSAADPSFDAGDLVSQRGPSRAAELRDSSGAVTQLPGTDPAIGGPYIAVLDGSNAVLLDRETLVERDREKVPGADAVAVSRQWLVVRARVDSRDRLVAHPVSEAGKVGDPRVLSTASPPAQVGRPSVDGSRAAYAFAGKGVNRIYVHPLGPGKRRAVLGSRKKGLSNPTLRGKSLLYVRSSRRRDELRLRKLGGGGDRRLRSSRKRLWSTALSDKRAYVTILKGGRRPRPRIASSHR